MWYDVSVACFPETSLVLWQLYFIENETSKALSVLHDVNCCKIWNMYRFFHFSCSPCSPRQAEDGGSVQHGSSCVNRSIWDQDVKFHCIVSNVGTWCFKGWDLVLNLELLLSPRSLSVSSFCFVFLIDNNRNKMVTFTWETVVSQ